MAYPQVPEPNPQHGEPVPPFDPTSPPPAGPPLAGPPSFEPLSAGPPPAVPPSFEPPPAGPPSYGPPPVGLPPAGPYGTADGAPYGVDPMSGVPLSDKNKVVAGLLQLLPGFLFGLGGIGRIYAGHQSIGIAQLVATVVGWVSFWCGFALILPFLVFFGVWLWFVIDGIMLLAGRPTDGQGRLLRT